MGPQKYCTYKITVLINLDQIRVYYLHNYWDKESGFTKILKQQHGTYEYYTYISKLKSFMSKMYTVTN